MPKKRTIHPENCRNVVREQISFCGTIITLCGKYSQEWSISKERNGKITIELFPDRISARKEFDRYKNFK